MRVLGILSIVLLGAAPALAQPPAPAVMAPRTGAVSFIGVRLGDLDAERAKSLRLPKPEGAVIESVNPNSPASAAGLRANDVIVEFDGEHVRSARQLTRLVGETPIGREVPLAVVRDGRRQELRIAPQAGSWFDPRLGGVMNQERWREFGEEMGRRVGRTGASHARLGVSVQPLTPGLAEYFGVKSGALVAAVDSGSAAEKAGVKAGDVITAVDGQAVASPGDLVKNLPADGASQEISLAVTRSRKALTLKARLDPAGR